MAATDRPVWRSLLFVPVNVEKYVAKAHTRGSDGLLLDLEDSVPLSEKATARKLVPEVASRVRQAGADVLVRINRPPRLAIADIEASICEQVDALALPKTMSASHVKLLAEVADEVEAERGLPNGHTKFVVMVETADAFFQVHEIAKAHPRMVALNLGGEDFSTDVGMVPEPDVLHYPKQHIIIAARSAGLIPLGIMGTVADYKDIDGMRAAVRNSKRHGCEGASCIHPAIVPILNEEFSPRAEEIDWAKRVIAAFEAAVAEGRASLEVDGKMIDYPIIYRAEAVLAQAEAIAKREARSSG